MPEGSFFAVDQAGRVYRAEDAGEEILEYLQEDLWADCAFAIRTDWGWDPNPPRTGAGYTKIQKRMLIGIIAGA